MHQFNHFKYTIQCHLVYSQCCPTITTIFKTCSSSQTKTLPTEQNSFIPLPMDK